ncbi:MAG TPA: hypothetical protein VFX39_08560 [Gemmatimonadaceae bacterium]|nr:hypothetical protein [Gemmatimonadaceae bacterium]
MRAIRLTTPLDTILVDPQGAPLTLGPAAGTELGIAILEHLEEGGASDRDLQNLVAYAARHDESAPARDAVLGVLLNGSETLPATLVARAREAIQRGEWGEGRETEGLVTNPALDAVPRRQAFTERLMAERARRLRPEVHAHVALILEHGAGTPPVPRWFLKRNWHDLRDTLTQRVRHEPMHREPIARWLVAQPAPIRAWMKPVEEALVYAATQAILHAWHRAPLAPYLGDERVADGIRTAVAFRGEPARERLAGYLARLEPGTAWYETIREIVEDPSAQ